ncbi:uncharacterized protein [Littorina saxatilis]|uniref:uncharacterized protein n=1 Tax=Littorina saxatilis TaxID=31220 RepID=UPI0038B647B8
MTRIEESKNKEQPEQRDREQKTHPRNYPRSTPAAKTVDFQDGDLEYSKGTVNGIPVTVVIDSGAVTAGVRRSLVRPEQYTGQSKTTISFGRNRQTFPLAVVPVETSTYTGNICCCVIDSPVIDLLLGNLEKIHPAPGLFGKVVADEPETPGVEQLSTAAATTRAQSTLDKKETKPFGAPATKLSVDEDELKRLQGADPKLDAYFKFASSGELKRQGKNSFHFVIENGVLYGDFVTPTETYHQIVVPEPLVESVLFSAHDTSISGHCSKHKTTDIIRARFFWPGMSTAVAEYLPALLFAIRELPNASAGFSPLQLLFGRQPKGPIDLLANAWTGRESAQEAKTTYQYVIDLKTMIYDACKVAHDAVDNARAIQKHHHDKRSTRRKFAVGDQVLLLLPTTANKLHMQWKGPYRVVEVFNNDYRIDMLTTQKVYHANMLKLYIERGNSTARMTTEKKKCQTTMSDQMPAPRTIPYDQIVGNNVCPQGTKPTAVAVLLEEEDGTPFNLETVELPQDEATFCWKEAHIDEELDPDQVQEVEAAFREFKQCLRASPGASRGTVVHSIRVTTDVPTRTKQYPLPFAAREDIIQEVKELRELGIIEPSTSPYCSPIVLAKKNSTRKRMCLDLRALNKITVFDTEPIPDPEEIFASLAGAEYFTKLDLAKGYYQIFIEKKDRPKTAFQTPQGLMQFCRVPFGLVSALATFARAMRELLGTSTINVFDDITWRQHVTAIRETLQTLCAGDFTAKPSKVYAGFRKLEFLGHTIGKGELRPIRENVESILKITAPATKKQVRSLLGMIGYYKKFVPSYSTLTAPMTNLLAGRQKGPVTWTDECGRPPERARHMDRRMWQAARKGPSHGQTNVHWLSSRSGNFFPEDLS